MAGEVLGLGPHHAAALFHGRVRNDDRVLPRQAAVACQDILDGCRPTEVWDAKTTEQNTETATKANG